MTTLGLSDGPEERPAKPPVHYQISVTGRQAGFFFLLLLAALALAFFFGMRTGAAARKGPGAVATLANASDLPVPTLAPSDSPRDAGKSGTERPGEEALGFAAEKRATLKEAAAAATPVPASQPPVPTAAPPAQQSAPPKEAPPKKPCICARERLRQPP